MFIQTIETSKPGEPLLKMTPALVRHAANYALQRYLRLEKDETSTRDFTAIVLPYECVVIVSWAVEDRRGGCTNKSRTFPIKAV